MDRNTRFNIWIYDDHGEKIIERENQERKQAEILIDEALDQEAEIRITKAQPEEGDR